MKILFIIALLSFAALAWAALAIRRHIRRNAADNKPPTPDSQTSEAINARLRGISRQPGDELTSTPRTSGKPDPLNFDEDHGNQIHPTNSKSGSPERPEAPIVD